MGQLRAMVTLTAADHDGLGVRAHISIHQLYYCGKL
jgi:hypothetical protein